MEDRWEMGVAGTVAVRAGAEQRPARADQEVPRQEGPGEFCCREQRTREAPRRG